jgi:predicted nucleic acid-binding protein
MRVALDTNILAYAEGVNGASMKDSALAIVDKLSARSTFLPVQVLGELFYLLVRKAQFSPERARSSLLTWQDSFPLVDTTASILLAAGDLAARHYFKIWDSVVLSAAAASGCRLLLSEDMQDGFTWSGVTIVNPFAKNPHELLLEALEPE